MALNKAKVITVTSVKGGVGKTTTVLNLAGIYSKIKKKILVVDLDFYSGDIAAALNISYDNDIYNLYEDLNNNKFNSFDDYVVDYDEYISVLSAPKDPRHARKITSKVLDLILYKASLKYDLILIGITKSGEWLIFNGNIDDIKNGKWETDKNNKKALLADSVEAVIAAIYLDSNIEEARKFILKNIKDSVEFASHNVGLKDYKTVLQEKLQVAGDVKIIYTIIDESGPDHDKTFVAEVECDGKKLAQGKGRSKKLAEMEAARKALEII